MTSSGDDNLDLAWMEGRLDRSTTFEGHVRTQIAEVRPGRASLYIEIEPFHLNGNGTLHGGVYATLIDNAMGFAVAALARVRIATTQMNVHFLGPISSGRITCTADVVHRTRRTATAEARCATPTATSWRWAPGPSASSSSRDTRLCEAG